MNLNNTQQDQTIIFYGLPFSFLLRFFSWWSGVVGSAILASNGKPLLWLGLLICLAELGCTLQRHLAGEVMLDHDVIVLPGSLFYRAQRIPLLLIEADHDPGCWKNHDVGTIKHANGNRLARISELERFKHHLHARRCVLLEQAAYEYARHLLAHPSHDQPSFPSCDQPSHALGCLCSLQQRIALEQTID